MSEKITLIEDGKIETIHEQLQTERMVVGAIEKFKNDKSICFVKECLHL